MTALLDSLSRGCPAAPSELTILGRTVKKHAEDVLASFDSPGTSNGRPQHLRGRALGFRNLTNCMAGSLLETDGFGTPLNLHLR